MTASMLQAAYHAHMNDNGLHGASVILTRPTGSAVSLTMAVRRMGGLPVSLPGLTLAPAADPAIVQEQLVAAQSADIVLFTSPAAVRFAWRLVPKLAFLRHTKVGAVGAGTAAALTPRGVGVALVPDRPDSSGLLASPALAQVNGHQIAVIGAPGGRNLIVPTLRHRGAIVERIDVYRRCAPRWTRHRLAALEAAPRPWLLLFSSAEALSHVATALPQSLALALRRSETIVSSARLAVLAQEHGFPHIHLARSALTSDLMASAVTALVPHRL